MLRRLFAGLLSPSGDDPSGYWIYVECDHCGEKLRARLDLQNDLSARFGKQDRSESYYCRKVLIGSERCFEPIEVELEFDRTRRLTSREIQGGRFISKKEYEAIEDPTSDDS